MRCFSIKKNELALTACLILTAFSGICYAKQQKPLPAQIEVPSLDPETAAFLKGFAMRFNAVKDLPVAKQREIMEKMPPIKISDIEPVAKVEDKVVDGRNGPIKMRVYSPKTEGSLPIIAYYHGGGWIYGGIEQSDKFCRRLANSTGAIVASIEYRLSPEHKFPIPLHDCYDATKWIAKNASTFLGDPSKLIVCGDSAGGNLAAAVALMTKEEKAFPISGQLLIYPVLTTDLVKENYDSSPDKSLISFKNMEFFINAYLASPEDGKNPYAAPLQSKNLSQLPNCFIMTAEYDALKHEGARYSNALNEAGTKTELKCYPGVIHGFLSFPLAEAVRVEAMNDIQAWVARL